MRKLVTTLCLFLISGVTYADYLTTGKGKILVTQGHVAPSCRMVLFQENNTGTKIWFRIADVQGHDDVSSVTLAALMGHRDVTITYNPSITTGCGTEPSITYISIY